MRERLEMLGVLLLTAAVLVSTWAFLPHENFFTGDSAVKLLQVENLLTSHYRTVTLRYNGSDIDPDSLISPFQLRPSVYVKDGRNYSLFPVLFPFLSSFFYAAVGYAGLYVLPLGSAVLCVPLAYAIARRFVPHRVALLAAGACVLATPMAFYSLTFWEHTPTVCLVLAAVWLLLRCGHSVPQAAASGLLLGAAVWLRTEIVVLMVLLYAAGWRVLRRPRALAISMGAAAVPLAGLAVFNKLVYGEWFGHIARNIEAVASPEGQGWMAQVNQRAGWLWTSLLGINAPQTLPAEHIGWERSFDWVMDRGASVPLEALAFCAVGGLVACSAIASSLDVDRQKPRPIPRWALGVQIALLGVLVVGVARYILTFPQDRSPLITVLKSGGVFPFSPFLAAVLIWPLLTTKDWPAAGEFKWLVYAALGFALIMPAAAPNDGGIRYGARYLLPAIAVLAILAVVVTHRLCGGWGRRGFQLALAAGLVLSVAIEVRGVQLLYWKKVFSRDFTAALMAGRSERVGMTTWWIPFEAPQALLDKKVYNIRLTAKALDWLTSRARQAGDATVDVVVLGRKDVFPPLPGATVVATTHVVHPFDTYFNLTIFTLSLHPR